MPESNPIPPHRRRLRPRLSLRALMVLVLILGGWLGWVVHRARVQREVVAAIYQARGWVTYDSEADSGNGPARTIWAPQWLVGSLGIDYFSSVAVVEFHKHGPGADEIAGHLARLSGLRIADSITSRILSMRGWSGLSVLRNPGP